MTGRVWGDPVDDDYARAVAAEAAETAAMTADECLTQSALAMAEGYTDLATYWATLAAAKGGRR